MKINGIIRKIDHLGRISIPMAIRKSAKIKDGDALECSLTDSGIVITKYAPDNQKLDDAINAVMAFLEDKSIQVPENIKNQSESLIEEIKKFYISDKKYN